MGLIIKNKIQMLQKGFPTVSDKYDVQGGLLGGTVAAHFGDVVVFGAQAGEYKVPTSTITVADIAGIVCGTNVKLATSYPAGPSFEVATPVGEAFNLLLKGYIAVELTSAVEADIEEGAAVACILASGKLTTHGVSGATDVPGYKFTGLYEVQGSAIIAEIVIEK